VLVGVDGDLHPVPQPELGQDAGDVALDGGFAEVEPGSDLGVRQALGHQPDDAELAFAEAPGRTGDRAPGGGAAAEVLDQPPGDRRCEQGLADRHRADGAGQLLAAGVLEQEAARAGLQRVIHVLVQVEGGQHQDPRPAPGLDQPGGGFDAVHAGHADVHQDHVGVKQPGLGQRLAAVAGLPGHGQVRLRFEQHSQAFADEVLVVGDQDADHDGTRAGRPSPSGSRARTA
jgi:hypothetical protein